MKVTKNNFKQLITADAVFVAFVTVFFFVMFIETFSIFEMGGTSSALLPRLLCVAGFIISVTILIVKLLAHPLKNETEPHSGNIVNNKQKGVKLMHTLLFTIGYFFLVPLLGFILTTIIVTVAFSFFMGYKKKVIVVIVAISTTVLLYGLFGTLLEVSLPQGIIIKSLLPF